MGSVIAAPLLAMAFAAGATFLYGGFEGAAAMGGGMIGGAAGVLAGFGGGLWLVLRKSGHGGGTAIAWLTAGATSNTTSPRYVAPPSTTSFGVLTGATVSPPAASLSTRSPVASG